VGYPRREKKNCSGALKMRSISGSLQVRRKMNHRLLVMKRGFQKNPSQIFYFQMRTMSPGLQA
jgi:hypothetical protein